MKDATGPVYAKDSLEALVFGERNSAHVLFDRKNLKLWIRKLTLRRYPTLIDVAHADARRERTGSFRRFVDTYGKLGLFFETVGNPHMAEYFERSGMLRAEEDIGGIDIPSYYMPTDDAGMSDELRVMAERLRADRMTYYGRVLR